MSGVPGGKGLLNKIYGLVQVGRCLFSIFYEDSFEQSEADPRVFRMFGDGEVEMVMVVHVDDILTHAKDQVKMERFPAGLGAKYKVKSMVEKFGVEKASRTSASSKVPTLSHNSSYAANPGIEGKCAEVPVPGGGGGAHVDGNGRALRARSTMWPGSRTVLKGLQYLLHTKEWGIT